ncbi:peptidase S8 S53 subtilisin kexin sedolisin, putative [Babesia ovis]|uniref:Peptidase S8 S53 subtilisin kexin sedolisin, putative n=1 Tax=Babesia ovis TaxID=5869 RepID=A0A9W5TC31_BABOV|nr:peptidase S8 S53 subtilisin kexin sedolisin, putative [Babesia ovis]
MATGRDFAESKEAVALVAEHLPDGLTCCAGLIVPQLARRLVRDFNDDGDSSVFDSTPGAVLIEFPFRKLMLESRVVQRLCYDIDVCGQPLYAKRTAPRNNLLLIDPARLVGCFREHLDSAKRRLLMRCFTAEVWPTFLKMVSLGIGERLRMLYTTPNEPFMDDNLLTSLEDLQLELVGITSKFTHCNSPGYTIEDIETYILNDCSTALTTAQNIGDKWGNVLEIHRATGALVSFLQKAIANVKVLLSPSANGHHGTSQHRRSYDNTSGIDTAKLKACCTEIVGFLTKAAADLSIVKMKMLEKRDELFQRPDLFRTISQEVFKRGIHTSEFDPEEIIPMIIMSHCMGAYGIREWCLRYIVETQAISTSVLEKELASRRGEHHSKLEPSPFFRTAGSVPPDTTDFVTLFPLEILDYLLYLCRKE